MIFDIEEKRDLPEELETKVSEYWDEQLKSYPGMFNGPLFSVKDGH